MSDTLEPDLLVTGISQLATPTGAGPKHGPEMSPIQVTEHAALAIRDGLIAWVGASTEWHGNAARTIDLGGRAVVPGLIDPHTHAIWAGSRLQDFDARTSGKPYEQILREGGGIRSSIRATAAKTTEELVRVAELRIALLLASGATTIEVKSGYGFAPATEIRMLQAIESLGERTPATIVPTLLIHIPPAEPTERAAYVSMVCDDLIPEVASRKLANAVDIFVEHEAWHAGEASIMLAFAKHHGFAIKLHTEQFQRIGGLELAVAMGALSADHLEACSSQQLATLAASPTIATLLPGVTLHLGIPAAPGRALIDAGAAIAIGTDLNPGSSPLYSMALALALSVRLNGLAAAEALTAGTVNAACALGLADRGRLEPGMRADFLVLEGKDWRELVYTLGQNPVRDVWIAGKIAHSNLREGG